MTQWLEETEGGVYHLWYHSTVVGPESGIEWGITAMMQNCAWDTCTNLQTIESVQEERTEMTY